MEIAAILVNNIIIPNMYNLIYRMIIYQVASFS